MSQDDDQFAKPENMLSLRQTLETKEEHPISSTTISSPPSGGNVVSKKKSSFQPLMVFIKNLLKNRSYNPKVISWISEKHGIFRVNSSTEFARVWGHYKSNRKEMSYAKLSRAMR